MRLLSQSIPAMPARCSRVVENRMGVRKARMYPPVPWNTV